MSGFPVALFNQLKESKYEQDVKTSKYLVDKWMDSDWKTMLVLLKERQYDEVRRVVTDFRPDRKMILEIFKCMSELEDNEVNDLVRGFLDEFAINSFMLREIVCMYAPKGDAGLIGYMLVHSNNNQLIEEAALMLVNADCDMDDLLLNFEIPQKLAKRMFMMYLEKRNHSCMIKVLENFEFDVEAIFELVREHGCGKVAQWIMRNYSIKSGSLEFALDTFSKLGDVDTVDCLLQNHTYEKLKIVKCIDNLRNQGNTEKANELAKLHEIPTGLSGYLSGWFPF